VLAMAEFRIGDLGKRMKKSWVLVMALLGTLAIAPGCERRQSPPVEQTSDQLQDRSRPALADDLPHETDGPRLQAGERKSKAAKKREADELFASGPVLQIEIEIPRSGMSALRRTNWQRSSERPKVKATVKEGGVVYHEVSVHLKGSAGSFRPVDDKPGLTLNFDKFRSGQSFHGLHKISLNNSVQDPTYLNEKICRELFDAAGVPVPRAGHALVKLNGRDLGLYVLLEGANKQFLRRYFDNTKGNLFDGGFCRDLTESLAVNCGDDPNNRSGLRTLILAARATRQAKDLAPLKEALDLDCYLSMLAMEIITSHWDGYTGNRNNWRIFHDLDSNRMVFIPHGLDQMFGSRMQVDPANPRLEKTGMISAAVLGTAEGRRLYRERVGQLYTGVFKVEQITSRADEVAARIIPALAKSNPQAAKQFEHQLVRFKQRVIHRHALLAPQLGPPPAPLDFGSDGAVELAGWKPSLVRSGEPVLSQVKTVSGQEYLAIRATHGISSGSWRTRVLLDQGRYQFEGRLRLNGVSIDDGDQRGGAGLRISKSSMPRKLTGTLPWTEFSYPFEVDEAGTDVELVCELRATTGEAWFDPASLRLLRLP
jgi:spore coat protein H